MEKTQFCCEPYKKMAQTFQWFSYVNEEKIRIFLMPSIEVDGTFWGVDHCPSCGAPTRSIEIPEDEYMEIMELEKK
jgi:hypothetical protein